MDGKGNYFFEIDNDPCRKKKKKLTLSAIQKCLFSLAHNTKARYFMEEQFPPTGKCALNYGSLLGGINVILGMVLYFQGLHTAQNLGLVMVSIVLTAGLIFWGIFNFKKVHEGFLTLPQALKIGTGIALVAALIGILYNMVLVNYIDPEVPAKIIEARLAPLLESGQMSQEQFAQQKAQNLKYWWIGYLFFLMANSCMGFILGLLTGLFLKKARPIISSE